MSDPSLAHGLDVFIGGGADDLMPGGGVLRDYAHRYAKETQRAVIYLPNARVRRLVRVLDAAVGGGQIVNVIGHSWGGPDAYRAVAALARRGVFVTTLITLDPVAGPLRRPHQPLTSVFWLNVAATPETADRSDRLTALPPLSRKPSSLPVRAADQAISLALHHWDVDGMMTLSGARARLDSSRMA